MNKWEVAILKIIAANDGTASLKHVYGELPSYVDLTDNHYEITYKAPAYHHQTRAHVDDLLDKTTRRSFERVIGSSRHRR